MTTNNGSNITNVPSGGILPFQRILSQTASSSPLLEFAGLNSSIYREYYFVFQSVLPATNANTFVLDMYDSGSAAYINAFSYYGRWTDNSGGSGDQTGNAANPLALTVPSTVRNDATSHGVNGQLWLRNFNSSTNDAANVSYNTNIYDTSNHRRGYVSNGNVNPDSQNVTKIKFFFTSGNIASGIITMYGLPL